MKRSFAYAALLIAAAFWGFGNISQKTVLDHVGPLTAVTLRCLIAAVVLLPLVAMERNSPRPAGYWSSALGVVSAFIVALCLQQAAYMDATVTNASFLVETCTVLTPLLAWFIFSERPSRTTFVPALVALGGIFLMSSGMMLPGTFNRGDLICLASAFFYAIWIVLLGRHATVHGLPFTTAFIQFLACAVVTSPVLLAESPAFTSLAEAWPNLLILGLFPTAAAFVLQTWAQAHVSAARAAVIVSSEGLFGAIGAITVLDERPTMLTLGGAAMIVIAVCLVSVPLHLFRRRGWQGVSKGA